LVSNDNFDNLKLKNCTVFSVPGSKTGIRNNMTGSGAPHSSSKIYISSFSEKEASERLERYRGGLGIN
jgi:hypothetical protein